jgi:hypothetical protein
MFIPNTHDIHGILKIVQNSPHVIVEKYRMQRSLRYYSAYPALQGLLAAFATRLTTTFVG